MKINVDSYAIRLLIRTVSLSLGMAPLLAAPAPIQKANHSTPVTILGLGESDHESAGAYEIVENRVKHWLERELSESDSGANVVLKGATGDQSLGPSLQQAHAVLAINALRASDEGQFRHHLEKAVLINPSHEVTDIHFERLMEGKVNADEISKWQRETKRVGQQFQRNCVVDLKTFPASAELRINGFARSHKKLLRLAKRIKHRLQVSAEGYETVSVDVECHRPSFRRLKIGLVPRPKGTLAGKWLEHESQSDVFSTWYLIERAGQGFRFYLFTPGVSLDEVPLERPLSVRDVLDNPGADTLPIVQSSFQNLLLRHRAVRVADLSSQKGFALPSLQESVTSSDSWYQDWRVWAFLGGVAIVAAVSHFATSENGVQTQPVGIRVPLP